MTQNLKRFSKTFDENRFFKFLEQCTKFVKDLFCKNWASTVNVCTDLDFKTLSILFK